MNLNFKKGPARTAVGGAGFTLIELLVVIAIIGILSGIVLTSLGTARDKARRSSAQASLSSMRPQAELGVSTSGLYETDICQNSAAGPLFDLITAVDANDRGAANSVTCNCSDSSGAAVTCNAAASGNTIARWAAHADIGINAASNFCVDSSGYAGAPSTATAGDCS